MPYLSRSVEIATIREDGHRQGSGGRSHAALRYAEGYGQDMIW